MDIKIKSLAQNHDRANFNCGVPPLNRFLKKYALQNQTRHISKTFVAVHNQHTTLEKQRVLGFYTLSTGQIRVEALPDGVKHPKYPVSIARLARLAVDLDYQAKGIGGFLLHDALQRVKTVAKSVGIFAVVVDAKDAKAQSFYKQYGFSDLQEAGLSLFLPMKTLEQLE